jgi:hypothetical protein
MTVILLGASTAEILIRPTNFPNPSELQRYLERPVKGYPDQLLLSPVLVGQQKCSVLLNLTTNAERSVPSVTDTGVKGMEKDIP